MCTHVDRWKLTFYSVPKIALIPYYHRVSQTELFGFIFPTIVDNRFVNRFVTTVRKMKPKSSVLENLRSCGISWIGAIFGTE
jgi:hypothetical protein